MKKTIVKYGVVVTAIALMLAAGCAPSGIQRTQKTLSSAETLRKNFDKFNVQFGKTMTALNTVETAKPDRLRSSFKKFDSEMKKMNSQSKRIITQSKDLVANSRGYIEAWEKQLSDVRNPQLRAQAEQRRSNASAELENTKDELSRIRQEYETFYKNLTEVRNTLETDLTPGGVNAVRNVISTTKADAQPLQNDINTIISGLDRIIALLSGTQS